MQENTNIQPTALTDVHNKKKLPLRARLGMAAAGAGFAGAMLIGTLFSGQAFAAPMQAKHMTKANAPLSFTVTKAAHDTYWNIAWQAATYYGIDPNLFERQINQESGFNPYAVSPAGAEGIAQFMPATASSMGVNPWDPTSALYGAANLMSQLNRQFGSYAMALAAYNAGPGAVQYAINAGGNNWYSYLPAETQNYVSVIMGW